MNVILMIELVVALLPQNGLFYEEEQWEQWEEYVNKEIDEKYPTIDSIYNFVSQLGKEAEFKKGLPTAPYPTSNRFGTRFDAPYSVILYEYYYRANAVYRVCGGALLAPNIVLSICSCVTSYILWVEGRDIFAKDLLDEDLGTAPLVTGFETGSFNFPEGDALRRFVKKGSPTRYELVQSYLSEEKKRQDCWLALNPQDAHSNAPWLLRTTFAVLKFEPSYGPLRSQMNIFVPWPPQPLAYDLTLRNKGVGETSDNHGIMWGVHYGRAPQTVVIPSFNFQLHHNDSPTITDNLGKQHISNDTLVHFRTTLCDQDYCVKDHVDIQHLYADDHHDYKRQYIGCFCDDNGKNTVCGGMIGAPIVHDGDLAGLLSSYVPCNEDSPRVMVGTGLDPKTIDLVYHLLQDLGELSKDEPFRLKTGEVDNYEFEVPSDDLMPQKFEIAEEELLEDLLSDSYIVRPSVILLMSCLFF